MTSPRSWLSMVLVLASIIAGTLFPPESHGQRRRSNSRSARAMRKRTVQSLEEKMKAVIAELEKSDADSNLDDFLSANFDKANSIARRISDNPSEKERLLRVLKKFEQAKVHLSDRSDTAMFIVSLEKEEAKALRPPKIVTQTKQVTINGYGDNLKAALRKGIEDLEKEKFQNFIRSIYPTAEVQRLIHQQQETPLISRLKTYPILYMELIREFRVLLELKSVPVEMEGRTVVSFNLPADPKWKKRLGPLGKGIPDQTAREVRFELIDGNWRFFDGDKKLRQQMKRQQMGLPAGGGISLEWKRTKQGWRISSVPFF